MSTTVLLSHLQRPNSEAPLQTIVAAISHHLTVDLPTPLAAAVVSSPFFLSYPPTHDRLQGLVTAFRHAVHLKHQALVKNAEEGWSLSRTAFSKGVAGGTMEWIRGALRGLQGGRPVLRLACCVGLLLGVRGIKQDGVGSGRVEDETIVALAEVMDDYNAETGDWEKEFQPPLDESILSLALILASQSLPLISKSKLRALPLSLLASLLTSTISSAFQGGNILSGIPESTSSGVFYVPPNSSFTQDVQKMSTSPTMEGMAGLSRLTALSLEIIIDSSTSGIQDAHSILEKFFDISSRIERGWRNSKLSSIENEEQIAPQTRDLSKSIWLLLKTFLFSTIMIADSILSAVVYARPQLNSQCQTDSHTLAKVILGTLFNLSFVVSQFGGVTATATSDEPGFTELRKVFYLGIDILSADHSQSDKDSRMRTMRCESFVRSLITDPAASSDTPVLNQTDTHSKVGIFRRSKIAYTLACTEQLVPLLEESFLKDCVWEFCAPHLSDPSYRETYESAHSAILAIFAAHAQRQNSVHLADAGQPEGSVPHQMPSEAQNHNFSLNEVTPNRGNSISPAIAETSFVRQMVPYYAECLIENSQDGRLNTAQLRLAYAALVRSACSSSQATSSVEAHHLGWYCIRLILSTIHELYLVDGQGGSSNNSNTKERAHRLHLTLISTVSSLPLPLMIRALEKIRSIITRQPQSSSGVGVGGEMDGRRRKELVDALFAEILEAVGDVEKEAAIKWWYAHRADFVLKDHGTVRVKVGSEKGEPIPNETDQSRSDSAVSHL